MKSNTRARILKIINDSGGARPIELVRNLSLSPQAIHRHLRSLASAGHIEARGRPPKTRYFIAGTPSLEGPARWATSIFEPAESPEEFVCRTRDAFSARLGRLGAFVKAGLKADDLSLVIAAAGEVGNNCFDHNLGAWRDVSGCWFQAQATAGLLWICLADRGQGVFKSLARADPAIPDEQAALVAAFERTLSGRAPENRGNGLKFVRNIVTAGAGRGLACRSGDAQVDYGALGGECRKHLDAWAGPGGTATLILWSLK